MYIVDVPLRVSLESKMANKPMERIRYWFDVKVSSLEVNDAFMGRPKRIFIINIVIIKTLQCWTRVVKVNKDKGKHTGIEQSRTQRQDTGIYVYAVTVKKGRK